MLVAPEATDYFDKEAFLHLTSGSIQVCFDAGRYEVVSVNNTPQVFATMLRAPWVATNQSEMGPKSQDHKENKKQNMKKNKEALKRG